MTRNDARAAEVAVARLAQRLAADPRLQAEILRARREFLGSEVPAGPQLRGAADTAEHRFSEWFALERESEALGVVPIELPHFGRDATELEDSLVGVFLVLTAEPTGVDARDLQDDAVYELAVPHESLQPGDLLAGRLFAVASNQWTPSTAAAVFRPGADLAEAFRRDVRRLDLGRRLRQVELEHLLLRRHEQTRSPTSTPAPSVPSVPSVPPAPSVPLEHLEAQLDKLLQAGGGHLTAAEVSQQLALAHRLGPVMGPLLDQLAFETNIDLDQGRRLLLEIWNVYHGTAETEAVAPSSDPAGAVPGETLGERLVRTLDEGLRQKRDVDDLFSQLERLAGLEPGASDDEENPYDDEREDNELDDDGLDDAELEGEEREDDDADEQAESIDRAVGDLGPLIQEYLWEAGREDDPAIEPLRLWVQLQANAPLPNSDLDLVTGTDLMRLLLHVFLGSPPSERAACVRAAFAELGKFYAWAEKTQELELTSVLQECQGPLLDQVDRLQAAGLALSTADEPSTRPTILQIEDLGPAGFGVRDDDGGHHWLEASASTVAALREGDLAIGALARAAGDVTKSHGPKSHGPKSHGQRLEGFVVVLPQDARALMG
ncbi:MAG: hypothetical protein ABIP94_16255 [Planctomycetota bacterium]